MGNGTLFYLVPLAVFKPEVDEKTPLVELFASLSYDDMWDDAALRDCIYYTRGSHLLEIPGQWRPVLPNSI